MKQITRKMIIITNKNTGKSRIKYITESELNKIKQNKEKLERERDFIKNASQSIINNPATKNITMGEFSIAGVILGILIALFHISIYLIFSN